MLRLFGISLVLFGYLVRNIQPFVTPDVISTVLQESVVSIDALRRAVVPSDLDNTLAISISQTVAGAVGAIASRRTALAIGDIKIDTIETKITATSAFFGINAISRNICLALGLPLTLSKIISSLLAAIISERAKIAGRTRSCSNHINNSTIIINPVEPIDVSEISGDIAKWITYDYLVDYYGQLSIFGSDISSFLYGSVAACAGLCVRDFYQSRQLSMIKNKDKEKELITKKLTQSSRRNLSWIIRYNKAALEGGVLFGSYSFINNLLRVIIPENFNEKFIFNQILTGVEDTIIQETEQIKIN